MYTVRKDNWTISLSYAVLIIRPHNKNTYWMEFKTLVSSLKWDKSAFSTMDGFIRVSADTGLQPPMSV